MWMPLAVLILLVARIIAADVLAAGYEEQNVRLVNAIRVVDEERECPKPQTHRRYAVVAYGMKGFKGAYLETFLRPWIHHIRNVESEADIVIAVPKRHVTPELIFLVNFSRNVYGGVYLRSPTTVRRKDISADALRFADLGIHIRNKFGWQEFQLVGIWNLDMYDGILQVEPDVWTMKPIRRLLWCTERFEFLSTVHETSAIIGHMFAFRPSKQTFRHLASSLWKTNVDDSGDWGNRGQFLPSSGGWSFGALQTFLFYFFYVEHALRIERDGGCRFSGYHSARIDFCKWGGSAPFGSFPEVLNLDSIMLPGCQAEFLEHKVERDYIIHSGEFLEHKVEREQRLIKTRQFDNSICWDVLYHTTDYDSLKARLPSHQFNALVLSEIILEELGAPKPYIFHFRACCDNKWGPRGNTSCWLNYTYEECCLLRPRKIERSQAPERQF